jgi:hypothetical protein
MIVVWLSSDLFQCLGLEPSASKLGRWGRDSAGREPHRACPCSKLDYELQFNDRHTPRPSLLFAKMIDSG